MSRDFHLFAGACVQCHRLVQFTAPIAEYKAWTEGHALIQNAMPSLGDSDREFLISGVCGKCFDELFKEDEVAP